MVKTLGSKVRLDLDAGSAAYQHIDLGPFILCCTQISHLEEKKETEMSNYMSLCSCEKQNVCKALT